MNASPSDPQRTGELMAVGNRAIQTGLKVDSAKDCSVGALAASLGVEIDAVSGH